MCVARTAPPTSKSSAAVRARPSAFHSPFAISRWNSKITLVLLAGRRVAIFGVHRPAVIDQNLGLPRTARPDGPLPDRDDQADDASDHQDQADRPQIQALDMEVGGEAQDRADRDQEDASRKGHISRP